MPNDIKTESAQPDSLHPAGSASGVESENCGECDRGRVPTWDGDGNETGDEPCQRCDGTGRKLTAKPTQNDRTQRQQPGCAEGGTETL